MNELPAFSLEIEDEYWLISEPNASTPLVLWTIFYANQKPDGVFFLPLASMDFKKK